MRLYVYEGSPEEIARVAATLPKLDSAVNSTKSEALGILDAENGHTDAAERNGVQRKFVSLKIARAVLSRRRLSPEQIKVLKAIYDAHPSRISAPKLQKLIGYSTSQFAGLMGAFGRRLSHTEGYVADTWFIDPEWNYDEHHNDYGLPETVREAMQKEKLA